MRPMPVGPPESPTVRLLGEMHGEGLCLAPREAAESAILITLEPGRLHSDPAQWRGNAEMGNELFEMYDLDQSP
jgi:hypothetical protein